MREAMPDRDIARKLLAELRRGRTSRRPRRSVTPRSARLTTTARQVTPFQPHTFGSEVCRPQRGFADPP